MRNVGITVAVLLILSLTVVAIGCGGGGQVTVTGEVTGRDGLKLVNQNALFHR